MNIIRRILSLCLCAMLLLGSAIAESPAVDIDLTGLNSNMVYAEVFSMLTEPKAYEGKIIKMKGTFTSVEDLTIDFSFYALLIADAAACCQQGFEFVRDDKGLYPETYPQEGEETTIIGRYETYQDDGETYVRLRVMSPDDMFYASKQ